MKQNAETASPAGATASGNAARNWVALGTIVRREVRRILRPRQDDRTKMANASRSVAAIATGTREQMHATLAELAEQAGRDIVTDEHGIGRVYLRTRADVFPTGCNANTRPSVSS